MQLSPTVISLFAGAGGSSLGYKMAGCHVLAASEFIAKARDVYAANHPDTILFPQDIRDLTGSDILSAIGFDVGEIDILDGSPPCAAFSECGVREKGWGKIRSYSDTNQRVDDLFFEYSRLVREIQPKVFIAENVKGLTIGKAKHFLGSPQTTFTGCHNDTIYHNLRNCGYNVAYRILNAADFGVPQIRKRLIIIGIRNDINHTPTFPRPTVSAHKTLGEALANVVNTKEELVQTDITRFAIWRRLQKMQRNEFKHVSGDSIGSGYFNLYRSCPNLPAFTLTAGNLGRSAICHWHDRKFTIPEMKAIMSFPQSYILTGSYDEQVERLGRAVPPLMSKAIAQHILATIFKEFKDGNSS